MSSSRTRFRRPARVSQLILPKGQNIRRQTRSATAFCNWITACLLEMWYLFQTLNNSVYRSVDGDGDDDDDDDDDELDDDEIDNAKDAMVKAAARRFLAVLAVWAAVYHGTSRPLERWKRPSSPFPRRILPSWRTLKISAWTHQISCPRRNLASSPLGRKHAGDGNPRDKGRSPGGRRRGVAGARPCQSFNKRRTGPRFWRLSGG